MPATTPKDHSPDHTAEKPVQFTLNKDSIGRALGRLASGVYIVTLRHQGQPEGMLATWVCQAAFEPPTVSIAINKQRHLLEQLTAGKALTINVLSTQNTEIFKSFARPAREPNEDRFAGLSLLAKESAGPIFSHATCYLNCQVDRLIDAGDHVLALATVTDGGLLNGESEPMVHLRKNGFQY